MEEERLLTVEEVLLLENLMYLPETETGGLAPLADYEGKTVGDLVRNVDLEQLEQSDAEFGLCMTGRDWKQLIGAIQMDEMLMMVHVPIVFLDDTAGCGGGRSAVFLNPRSGEAVVAFRGTSTAEWKDNFQGGGSTDAFDRVSTRQQLCALRWYQTLPLEPYFVTVTGHSKGGNKAKYIAILDDSVDRCLSFDGQGFSDEFMEWYSGRIMDRRAVIENHNVTYDYVGLLLEDVGTTTWYQGREYGYGEFLKNHCPAAFFLCGEDGRCRMRRSVAGQAKLMRRADNLLTGYLRSLSGQKKRNVLELVGSLAQYYAGKTFSLDK